MAETHIPPGDLNKDNLLPEGADDRKIKDATVGDATGATADQFRVLLEGSTTPMELDNVVLPFGSDIKVEDGAGEVTYGTGNNVAVLQTVPGGGYELNVYLPHDRTHPIDNKVVRDAEAQRVIAEQEKAGLIPNQVPWHADSEGRRELTEYKDISEDPTGPAEPPESDTYAERKEKIDGKDHNVSFNRTTGAMVVDNVQQRVAISGADLRELLAEHQEAAAIGQRLEKAYEEKTLHVVPRKHYGVIRKRVPGLTFTGPVHYDTKTGTVFDGRRAVAFLNTDPAAEGGELKNHLELHKFDPDIAGPYFEKGIRAKGAGYEKQSGWKRVAKKPLYWLDDATGASDGWRDLSNWRKKNPKQTSNSREFLLKPLPRNWKRWWRVRGFERAERATTPGPPDNDQVLTTNEKGEAPDRTGIDIPDQQYGGPGLFPWPGWRNHLRTYRSGRQHRMLSGPDTALRYAGSVGVGSGVVYGATQMFGNTLASSAIAETAAVYGAGPAALGGLIGIRAGADQWRYRYFVRPEFDRICMRSLTSEEQDKGPKKSIEGIRKDLKKYGAKASQKLLDTSAEQHLIEALHARKIADPSIAPFMRTERQYAEYAYTRFSLMCEAAHQRDKQGKSKHPGLTQEQHDTLAAHYLPAITDPAEHEKKRKNLLQMSVVYGRIIKHYHKKKRTAQTGGGIFGSTLVMSAATGSFLPGAIGIGTFFGKKIWDKIESDNLHIEVGADGELRGKDGFPILSPDVEVDAGEDGRATLYHAEEFTAADGQTFDDIKDDDAGGWHKKMVLPPKVQNMRFGSQETYLKTCAAFVLNHLLDVEPPKEKPKDADIEHAKQKYELEQDRYKALRKEGEELPDKIAKMKRELDPLEADWAKAGIGDKIDSNQKRIDEIEADLPHKDSRMDVQLKKEKKRLEDLNIDLRNREETLKGRVQAKAEDINEAEERLKKLTGPDNEIDKQEAVWKQAGEDYEDAKEDKPGTKKTADELAEDPEVRKAFNVFMQPIMKARKEGRQETWKKAGGFATGTLKALKESGPGQVIMASGASGLIGGGVTAGTMAFFGIPGAITTGVAAAVVFGGVGLYGAIKSKIGL